MLSFEITYVSCSSFSGTDLSADSSELAADVMSVTGMDSDCSASNPGSSVSSVNSSPSEDSGTLTVGAPAVLYAVLLEELLLGANEKDGISGISLLLHPASRTAIHITDMIFFMFNTSISLNKIIIHQKAVIVK